MPLYTYECANNHLTERSRPVVEYLDPMECEVCGLPTRLVVVGSSLALFPEGEWEHLDVNPVRVSSKRQLVEECRKRGVFAPAYMSGAPKL